MRRVQKARASIDYIERGATSPLEISAATLRTLRSDLELVGVSTAKYQFLGAYYAESRIFAAHLESVLAMIAATLE